MSADPADEAGVERSVTPEPETVPADTHGELWVAPDEPLGIEPTLRAIQRAIEQVEQALEAAGDARTTLVELGSGLPGDDLVLLGFLRQRLIPAEQRLLSTLAGLSEEHRGLLRSNAELGLIHSRAGHDPAPTLARLAASTAAIRRTRIASYVPPRPTAASPAARRIDRQLDQLLPSERHPARPASDGISVALGRLGGIFRSRPAEGDQAAADRAAAAAAGAPPVAPETIPTVIDLVEPEVVEEIDELAPLAIGTLPPAGPEAGAADGAGPEDETSDDDDAGGAAGGSAAATFTATAVDGTAIGRPTSVRPRSGTRARSSRRVGGAATAVAFVIVGISALNGFRPGADAATGPGGSASSMVAGATDIPVDVVGIPVGDDHPTPEPAGSAAAATPVPSVDSGTAVAAVVARGSTERKVIALTFDDGYAPANVRSIFETLVAEGVKATFFINGYYLSRDPALWKEIAQAGFPTGNHTYYHRDIRGLTDAEIATELKMTENAWRRVTGSQLIPYFRPPYGSHDARTDAAVAAHGYGTVVMWDTSNGDTKRGVTAAAATASGLKGTNGSIVLLHAGPDVTPKILRQIIAGYRARGFEFVTIPELLGATPGA